MGFFKKRKKLHPHVKAIILFIGVKGGGVSASLSQHKIRKKVKKRKTLVDGEPTTTPHRSSVSHKLNVFIIIL